MRTKSWVVALELDGGGEAARLEARPDHPLGELDALRAPAVDRVGEVERGGEAARRRARSATRADLRGLGGRHVAAR
jgi:hypothetical protein